MLSTSGGLRVPRPLRFRSHGRSAFRVSTPGGPRQSPRLRIARPLAQRVFTDDDLRPAKPLSARRRAPPSMHRSALPERTRFLAAPHLLLSLWLASGLAGDAVQYSDFEPDWVIVCHSHDDDGDGEDDIEHEDEDGDEQGGEEGVVTEVHISNVGICVGREHGGEERTLSRTNGFLGTPASPFAEYAEKCGRGKLCTGWEARTRAADRPSWPLQRPPDSHDPVRQEAQSVLRAASSPSFRRYTRLVARQVDPPPPRPTADTARQPHVRLSPSSAGIASVDRGGSLVAATDGLVAAPTTFPRQALVHPDVGIESSAANGGIILGAVISAAIAMAAVIAVWMVLKRLRKMELPATQMGATKGENDFSHAFQINRGLPTSGSVPSFARAAPQAAAESGTRSIVLDASSADVLSNPKDSRAPFAGGGIPAHTRTPSQATGTSYASSSRRPGPDSARWVHADRPPAGPVPTSSSRQYQMNNAKRAEDWASLESPSFTSSASFCSSSSSFSASSFAAAGGASLYANRSMPNLPLPSYRHDNPHRGAGGWHHSALSGSALSLPTLLSDAAAPHSASSRTWSPPTTPADRVAMARVRMLIRGDDADDRSIVNWKKVHAAAARSGSAGFLNAGFKGAAGSV